MKTIRVKPNGNNWIVTWGSKTSNHRLKRRAIDKAKRWADASDSIIVHRSDGTVQTSMRGR